MFRNRMVGVLAALSLAAAGCGVQAAQARNGSQAGEAARPHVVEIVLTGHAIDLPDEIPSGWTTFRLVNETDETHFGLIDHLPEGRTVEDSIRDIVPVFQDGMDLLNAGDVDAALARFGELPEWGAGIVYTGGPGFVGPGGTAETTVFLEPGAYVMECYVKTGGVFHTTHGMIAGFEVTEEDSGMGEPAADVTATLSYDPETGEGSIELDGELRPGRRTIAVEFADQTVHGNFLGHDLHIARIDEDTDLDALGVWMNWITGLEVAAPVEFLGGTHDMPAGSTAYVHVTLTPGTYVLVSEVDDPVGKGLLETVTVP